jgi:hypothetical protein
MTGKRRLLGKESGTVQDRRQKERQYGDVDATATDREFRRESDRILTQRCGGGRRVFRKRLPN